MSLFEFFLERSSFKVKKENQEKEESLSAFFNTKDSFEIRFRNSKINNSVLFSQNLTIH